MHARLQGGATLVLPGEQREGPSLVELAAASGKARQTIERLAVPSIRPVRTAASSSGAKAADGWPILWMPPRKLTFTDAVTLNESEATAAYRKGRVRAVMKRAWDAYRIHAWVRAQLNPPTPLGGGRTPPQTPRLLLSELLSSQERRAFPSWMTLRH